MGRFLYPNRTFELKLLSYDVVMPLAYAVISFFVLTIVCSALGLWYFQKYHPELSERIGKFYGFLSVPLLLLAFICIKTYHHFAGIDCGPSSPNADVISCIVDPKSGSEINAFWWLVLFSIVYSLMYYFKHKSPEI